MKEDVIRAFLERMGRAISAGDLAAVSRCWSLPALVVSDDNAIAVDQAATIERFFAGAFKWYQSQGLVGTRPELQRVETLSEKLSAVDVRWPAFDAAGVEKSSERSHYILQLSPDGQPRIRLALTRTA